jgi:ferric-dicitrate binding protein FerR (iron transport regulator)
MTTEDTRELPDVAAEPEQAEQPRRSGFWREASGALALGLVALAVVVLAFQVFAWVRGTPGPGIFTVVAHWGAAALAVLAQRIVDRSSGRRQALAVLTVAVAAGATLWLFWWA